MGCGDVRLLRTIGGVDFTGQERATLNKLTMPCRSPELAQEVERHIALPARPPSAAYSFSKPWLVNFSVRLFSVTVRTT